MSDHASPRSVPHAASSSLPSRPDLSQLRKQAKELLADFRGRDVEAVAAFTAGHPRAAALTSDPASAKLSDATLVLARRYGFASWSRLRRAVLHRRLVLSIQEGDDPEALSALSAHPWLAGPPEEEVPSALHWAAFKDRAAVVDRLIALGADLDTLDPKFGSPPVGWANEGGHDHLIERLIQAGAEVDLSRAAAAGRLDRVQALLREGAELTAASSDDLLPLAQAAGWGHAEVVACLLEAGAPVDGRSEGGLTALHAAVEWGGHASTARLLLAAGADPDAADDAGRTPRSLADASDSTDLIELFSSGGAK